MLRHRFHHTSFRNGAVGFRSSHRYCSGCFHFSRATAENTTSQRRSRRRMSTADFLFPFVHIFPQVKQHDTPRRGTADVYDLLSSPRPKFSDMFFSSGIFFFFSVHHIYLFWHKHWIWGQNVKVLRSTRCLFVHLVHFLIFCSCLDLCASSGDFLPLIYGRQESFSSSTLMLQYQIIKLLYNLMNGQSC